MDVLHIYKTKALALSQTTNFKTLPCFQYKSFENIAGIGQFAHNKQFLLFTTSI